MRSFLPASLLTLGLLVAVPDVAFAGEVERAEHTRLSEEMRKFAQRNVWSGVETSYRKLLDLEARGESIDAKEHLLGAQSARALGDATSARARYVRAKEGGAGADADPAIAEIDANFGAVSIKIERGYTGPRALTIAEPPFLPDQRACLEYVTKVVAEGQSYTGLLPLGDYTVDGKTFSAKVGETAAPVVLAPEKGAGAGTVWAGPRATVGVAFTTGGAPSADAESGLQAGAFGGGGARVGVGYGRGFTSKVGMVAEVGYHSLFGAPQSDGEALPANAQFVVSGNSLHMGYSWLGAEVRMGKLWLAAGPSWGMGRATVTGADGYCTSAADACPDLPDITSANARYQRLSGTVMAAGGTGSASFAVVNLGSLAGAVTLQGGAQSDSVRWYPWGQLAFTLAPSGSREE
jgi:hypothetical protein